jgi:hypothetical protein
MKRALLVLPALILALAYLRDPGWLGDLQSGVGPWRSDSQGHRFRWTSGHASFFVPADARLVRLPMSASFKDGDHRPVIVRITVNDRDANLVRLEDEAWVETDIVLAGVPTGHRNLIRIDLFVDHVVGDGDQGVRLGGAAITR